jgi:hypothetical protein
MIDDRSVSLCRIDRTCGPIHPLLKSRIVTRHHEWINLGNHEIRFCTFKNKKNEKRYTYSVKYIVSMIIEDPKKRKSKKKPPDVEPLARPGTTLTTRTTRARDSFTMSAVAMSALTASKSAAIAGGAVRAKRATPAAAPRSLVVRISFSSLVLLARSCAPRRNRIIRAGVRDRYIWETGGSTDAARCASPARRTTRGMIRMNIFLFVYPRTSSRASSRASRRRDAGVFKRVSRCPRARVRCPKNARCYPISRGDPTDVRRVFDARRGV